MEMMSVHERRALPLGGARVTRDHVILHRARGTWHLVLRWSSARASISARWCEARVHVISGCMIRLSRLVPDMAIDF